MNNFAVGVVKEGHGVASGKNFDARFPDGTIAMQMPYFKRLGIDLKSYFKGTINISFPNHAFKLCKPEICCKGIKWCSDLPAENFSFFSCWIQFENNPKIASFVYWPHPSTKPDFYQDPTVLEFLAPRVSGLSYGQKIIVFAKKESISFSKITKKYDNHC